MQQNIGIWFVMITLATFLIEFDVLVFVAVVLFFSMSEAVSFRFTIVRLCIRNITIDTFQLKTKKNTLSNTAPTSSIVIISGIYTQREWDMLNEIFLFVYWLYNGKLYAVHISLRFN